MLARSTPGKVASRSSRCSIQIQRVSLVVCRKTRVDFQKVIRVRLQPSLDRGRLASAPNEERGRREQRERKRNLNHDELDCAAKTSTRLTTMSSPACPFKSPMTVAFDNFNAGPSERRTSRKDKTKT